MADLTPAEWHARLDTARRWRQTAWAHKAREHIALYQGVPIRPLLADTERVSVNIIFSYIKALVAILYAQDPTFVLEPQQESAAEDVETLQLLLNYYWRTLNGKEETKLCLRDALLTGWGWMEYGYQAEFGIEGERPATQQRPQSLLKRALAALTPAPGSERKTDQGQVVEFNEYIQKESLFMRRLSPFVMLVPWDINRPVDWPWLAYELYLEREELEGYPGLKQDLIKRLQPSPHYTQSTGTRMTAVPGLGLRGTTLTGQPQSDRFRLIKVWDKRTRQRLIFGEGIKDPLSAIDWPYDFDGFPIVPLMFNSIPETDAAAHTFPLAMVEPARPLIEELSKMFTHLTENRKRFHTKVLVDQTIPDDVIRKITDAEIGGAIVVPGIGSNPNLIRELNFRPNDAQLEAEYRMLTQLLEIQLHLQMINSQTTSGVDTATEANILQQGLLAQISEMKDVIETFAAEGAERILAMRNFITSQVVLKVTGDSQRAGQWVHQAPAEIEGRYEVLVEAGSTLIPHRALINRKQLLEWLNLSLPIQQAGLTSMDIDQLMKTIARTYPEIKDINRLFNTSPQAEQQLIQEENQLLAQGLPVLVHPKDNHALHLQGHAALGQSPQMSQTAAQHLMTHHQLLQGTSQPPMPNGPSPSAPQLSNAAVPALTRHAGTFPDMLSGLRATSRGTGAEANGSGLGGGVV